MIGPSRWLGAAVLFSVTASLYASPPPPVSAALSPAEDLIVDVTAQVPDGAPVAGVIVSSTQDHLVYTVFVGGSRQLYSVSTGGGQPVLLLDGTLTDSSISNVSITADGATVLFISDHEVFSSERLYAVPIGGGVITALSDIFVMTTGDVHDYVITPDGQRVVFNADWQIFEQTELFITDVWWRRRTDRRWHQSVCVGDVAQR